MNNDFIPNMLQIKDIKILSPDNKLFRFKVNMKHDPGQFVQVSVINTGEAPISISSYSDKYIELSVRKVGNVTGALHDMKKGELVGIRGPYGNGYPMRKISNHNVIVIGGGCGVAPVRSVIQYIEQNRDDFGSVDIYFGFRTPEDVLFKKDLKAWQKKFRVHLTVDKADDKWVCDVGVVTNLLEKDKPNNEKAIAICCGPPVMIKFVVETLEKLNFNDEQIYVSLERLMQCGTQKCGHCLLGGRYICKDGPVFRFSEAKNLED